MSSQPLISLAQARTEIKQEDDDVREDAYILQALRILTERIELKFGYSFVPSTATRYWDAVGTHIDSLRQTLYLGTPLLALTSVTAGDETLTLWDGTAGNRDSSQVYDYPLHQYPIWSLRLLPSASGLWHSTINGDYVDAIAITGLWGYHRDYARAWLDSGDTVLNNPLSSSSTTVTVADADGADGVGRTPRFSPGNLLRIGSEFLPVNAVNIVTNILKVERGGLGSTAAAHTSGTVIEVWQSDGAIQRAAMRWVSYLYKRRGEFGSASFDGLASVTFPPDLPEEVTNILNDLYPKRIFSL